MSPPETGKKTRHLSARQKRKAAAAPVSAAPDSQTAADGDGDGRQTLRLSAIDTWFFRESRPHNALGASELRSLFPPPPATIAGALRTAIGDARSTDWQRFNADPDHPLRAIIGHGNDLGPLQLDGPWLELDGTRLYAAPAFLLARGEGGQRQFQRLRVGTAAHTDLGHVHLPTLPEGVRDYQPLTDAWVTAEALRKLLSGGRPRPEQVYTLDQLCISEPRLGIARDPRSHSVQEGMLYQTRHLRPRPELSVAAGVRGLDPAQTLPAGTLARLGGEGRLASLELSSRPDPLPTLAPQAGPPGSQVGLILLLLTAADTGNGWLPPGFRRDRDPADPGPQSWSGKLHGIPLRIRAAALGRAQRRGGWDQAASRPRAVRSLLPPGSAWYCEPITDSDLQTSIDTLHGSQLPGTDNYHQQLGHGQIAAGLWPSTEHPAQEHTP